MIVPGGTQATPGPVLGASDPFVILSTAGITDVPGTSLITGDIGVEPITGASITGITCAQVTGTIFTNDGAGPGGACAVTDAALLGDAIADLEAAGVDAAGRTPDEIIPVELGNTTLTPGVYTSAATTFLLTGTIGPLTLDGLGDPNAVFIFQSPAVQAGALTVDGGEVILTNSAQACNVWWSTGGATMTGAGSTFKGNILSASSITLTAGTDVEGRLMSRQGNVTLDDDTITRADCAIVPPVQPGPPGPPEAPPFLTIPPNFTG